MSGAPRLNFGLYANNRASVFLPDFSMERLLDLAVEAEELGYHSVWVGDSLLAKPRYDPIVTLTAIAARTKNIKLATGILQPHMRNPVVVALEWATLDIISKGRTIMGVGPGAGSPELLSKECEVAGFQRKVRGKVFEECLEVLKALWTRDSVDFEGRHYRYRDVSLGYKPVQEPHPPIWIAAGHYNPVKVENYRYGHFVEANAGKHTGPFDRVARLADGWLTNHISPRRVHGAVLRNLLRRRATVRPSARGRPPGHELLDQRRTRPPERPRRGPVDVGSLPPHALRRRERGPVGHLRHGARLHRPPGGVRGSRCPNHAGRARLQGPAGADAPHRARRPARLPLVNGNLSTSN